MDEEDILICHQCSGEADSLEACRGGCGKELCPYCQPKCHECTDRKTIQRIEEQEQEEEEEKRRRKEAEKRAWQPDRSVGQKVVRVLDWATGFADGALRRELEARPGEFKMYEECGNSEAVQEMMKLRWKDLPEWKKKVYRAKKKTERLAMKGALKIGTKGGRLIRKSVSLAEPLVGPLAILKRGVSADDDWDDQGYDDYDEQDYEDHADGQDYEEDADIEGEAESYDEPEEDNVESEDYENGYSDEEDEEEEDSD